MAILNFANDVCFYLPEETFALNWPGTTYVYHLNEPNPWDGPFKGYATHILDVVLLFKNFDHHLESKTRKVGEALGDGVITFVNGQAPWEATTKKERTALVLGGSAGTGIVVEDKPEVVGRRTAIHEVGKEVGWDALHDAFTAFLGGR